MFKITALLLEWLLIKFVSSYKEKVVKETEEQGFIYLQLQESNQILAIFFYYINISLGGFDIDHPTKIKVRSPNLKSTYRDLRNQLSMGLHISNAWESNSHLYGIWVHSLPTMADHPHWLIFAVSWSAKYLIRQSWIWSSLN